MKTNLKEQVRKSYKKTFIDPKLLKYTREFSDEELREWEKEDALNSRKTSSVSNSPRIGTKRQILI